MKSNEAPKKIYLYPDDRAGYEYDAEWGDKPWGEGCVEYARTDAFIEKACTYWHEKAKEGEGEVEYYIMSCIEGFKKYLKGE